MVAVKEEAAARVRAEVVVKGAEEVRVVDEVKEVVEVAVRAAAEVVVQDRVAAWVAVDKPLVPVANVSVPNAAPLFLISKVSLVLKWTARSVVIR